MTRRGKWFSAAAIGLVAILVLAGICYFSVPQTTWFRAYLRNKIISVAEEATGGKVEIGSVNFDSSHARAVFTNIVVHGTEPANAAPFLKAARVELDFRLLTSFRHLFDISYLGVERPEANIIVFDGGQTNIPSPKQDTSSSKTTALETVVDLAVAHFSLSNGLVIFNARKQQVDLSGNNLNIGLWFNTLARTYTGTLEMEPFYVASKRKTPVRFRVKLPVTLERDRVLLKNASIASDASSLVLNGALENLNDPKVTAHINGHIGLADLKNAGNVPLNLTAGNAPRGLDLDANATISNEAIQVTTLRVHFGLSTVEASGALKNGAGLEFKSEWALGELGRLLDVSSEPDGWLDVNGTARLDAGNKYLATGNLHARNISFVQGRQRFNNIDLTSALRADPHTIELQGLTLNALGGRVAGNIALQDMARYSANLKLSNLDIQTILGALGQKQIAYDGVVAGLVDLSGSLNAPGTKGLAAQTRLSISPKSHGIPVSGRLTATYNGASGNIAVDNSFISLPHTHLTASGSLNNLLNIALTTRDLKDFVAASPVALNGSEAVFTGTVTGSLDNPKISGRLEAAKFSLEGRVFDTLRAEVAASDSGAAIRSCSLRRGAMQAQFTGAVGLRNWNALPQEPLTAGLSLTNGDLADVAVLAGQPAANFSGALAATAHVDGTVGNPRGAANIEAANGSLYGEAFNNAVLQVNMTDRLVTIPSAYITSGSARVNLTAEFQHPRGSFGSGHIHAHIQTNQVQLEQIRSTTRQQNAAGAVQLNAEVEGSLSPAGAFVPMRVNAEASARGLRFAGQTYGDLTAAARTNGQSVTYNITSNFAGSNIRLSGNTLLANQYTTTADAEITRLPIERVLAAAKQNGISARGNLSGSAHFTGAIANPQGSAEFDLANAVLYEEPIEHVRARGTYLSNAIEVSTLDITAAAGRIDLTGRFDHPANNLQTGTLKFKIDSARIDLAKVRNVQRLNPALGGALQIKASGAGTLRAAEPRLELSTVNANLRADGVTLNRKALGNLALTASDAGGSKVNFALDSNLAGSAIHGQGNAQLSGDYPVDAHLAFNNVSWSKLQPLIGPGNADAPAFEVLTDGLVTYTGPAMKSELAKATLRITRLNIDTLARPGLPRTVGVHNQGPIELALDGGTVRIASAHLAGPDTDILATGAASIPRRSLSVNVTANANLALLQSFSRDIVSSGAITATTAISGFFSKPLINGQLQLKNASLNYASLPNGISNANGTIVFNGDNAVIRGLEGETGGGQIRASGFVSYSGAVRFGLDARASNVRVRIQQGVSVSGEANLHLTGTTAASVMSGNVTVDQLTYAPKTDIGALLSRSSAPVQSENAPSPLLDNMKLDIRVQSSPSLGVQASVAENLQASADLRVRGTASQPGVLGRINVSEGQLVFFGSTYTVNTGTIAFYNPLRIAPILNITLETQAQGVDVVLTVSGPIDNMKLSYTSDPPLQFQEIVGLLASGNTPTSDPTLLANQPQQPSQTYEQMGESAIVGKALADPVASRLQRVFGVTQLKIDPAFTSGSQLPTARLTFQQQITSNVTFTYTSALDDPNSTIIRAEWSFNPRYSAVATRDQNGLVSLVLYYKRQFR